MSPGRPLPARRLVPLLGLVSALVLASATAPVPAIATTRSDHAPPSCAPAACPLAAGTLARGAVGQVVGVGAVGLVHGFWTLVGTRRQDRDLGRSSVDLSDLSRPTEVERRLREAVGPAGNLAVAVAGGRARRGAVSIGPTETLDGHLLVMRGPADVYGKVMGNLVALGGDVAVHPGGLISGDVLTLGGKVRDAGGEIAGEVRELGGTPAAAAGAAAAGGGALPDLFRRTAGVAGVFVTLCLLGFGLVMFGRPNLEIVSDTVAHSFGRAFIVGLLGQILLLPTFGMLVVGLVLSVAGILLLPFAVIVYALLVIVGVVGGYLAVAHAMGETYVRRRLAQGVAAGSPNSYRYLLLGLAALATVWLAWALFGWVPVAGTLIWSAAFFVTWLLGTAGLGAALLSRAGLRGNFAGRLIPPEAFTDEYLWATPQYGVEAARRTPPGGKKRPARGP